MKEKIAKWFKQGLWNEAMVRSAVEKGRITAEDYEAITGENWEVAE